MLPTTDQATKYHLSASFEVNGATKCTSTYDCNVPSGCSVKSHRFPTFNHDNASAVPYNQNAPCICAFEAGGACWHRSAPARQREVGAKKKVAVGAPSVAGDDGTMARAVSYILQEGQRITQDKGMH